MKSTGIVRKVDELGRVVLPKELRTILNISVRDSLEIFVDGDVVLLKKYKSACVFCDNIIEDNSSYKGRTVCKKCLQELALLSE